MTFVGLLNKLGRTAPDVDRQAAWPRQQIEWLSQSEVIRSVIPKAYGGNEVDAEALTKEYHDLAKACLTTCFILTQRNGACQRIAGSENDELKSDLLPKLANGELFATVGISHLTTSGQHLAKPLVAGTITDDAMILNGTIPWVTGAIAADVIVTGATCDDGRQILCAMPTDLEGITIRPRVELMALTASETTSIGLENVVIPKSSLLAGPIKDVMSQGTGGGAGSLTTSTLALGVITRILDIYLEDILDRPDLAPIFEAFLAEYEELNQDLFAASRGEGLDLPQRSAASIRQRSNSLALRITQAALTISKGAGFVKGHPVERSVREAMFFLVWSCPQPVAKGVLEELCHNL